MDRVVSSRLFFLVLPQILACSSVADAPVELRRESAHFSFESTTEHASDAEISDGILRAEQLFEKIAAFVGLEHTPTARIRVVLEGDQTTRGSYLDVDGIHLFRYPTDEGGYRATLAHEMVHAFGASWFIAHAAWNWPTYRFFDEGFAEYVAQQVDSSKYGFPFFGFPEDVVAGYWLVSGRMIPFSDLRQRHDPLNDRCNLQAYTLRASWFRYFDTLLGRPAVLRIVYGDREPTTDVLQQEVGVSLEELDHQWQSWISARFNTTPGADELGRAFTQRASWYHACVSGIDFQIAAFDAWSPRNAEFETESEAQ